MKVSLIAFFLAEAVPAAAAGGSDITDYKSWGAFGLIVFVVVYFLRVIWPAQQTQQNSQHAAFLTALDTHQTKANEALESQRKDFRDELASERVKATERAQSLAEAIEANTLATTRLVDKFGAGPCEKHN